MVHHSTASHHHHLRWSVAAISTRGSRAIIRAICARNGTSTGTITTLSEATARRAAGASLGPLASRFPLQAGRVSLGSSSCALPGWATARICVCQDTVPTTKRLNHGTNLANSVARVNIAATLFQRPSRQAVVFFRSQMVSPCAILNSRQSIEWIARFIGESLPMVKSTSCWNCSWTSG